jgi:DNA-binding NarL/FixJ family response regulator
VGRSAVTASVTGSVASFRELEHSRLCGEPQAATGPREDLLGETHRVADAVSRVRASAPANLTLSVTPGTVPYFARAQDTESAMSDPMLLPVEVATLDEAQAAVRDSPLSVGLVDMSAGTLLGMSRRARRLLGFDDLRTNDDAGALVSDDPRATGDALALVLDGTIDGYKGNRRLRSPDGRVIDCTFALQAIEVDGLRRFAFVSFTSARFFGSNPDHAVEIIDLVHPIEPDDASDVDTRTAADRVAQLEQHLWRIAHEIEAAGVISTVARSPAPSSVPGLSDLSTRQWEVTTRLLRGERVSTIAREMYLSPSTVRNHLAPIYRKVGVRSQAELLELLRGAR